MCGEVSEIRMVQLREFTSRAANLGQLSPNPSLDSFVEENWGKAAQFGAPETQKLAQLRLTDIRIPSFDLASGKENRIRLLPELPFDDKAVVVPKLATTWPLPNGKYFAETSPRKGSRLRRWRRVRRQPRDNPLQLNIDILVLATGNSLGIIGLKMTHGHGDWNRKRVGVKHFGVGGKGRKTHRRAIIITDMGDASFVEPCYLMAPDAGDALSNNGHTTMSVSHDGDRSEDRQSEEVQLAYKRDSDIGEEMIISEEQSDENDWSWVNQDKNGDALAESVSSLHTTQQVLESEVQRLSELGKELEAEESTSGNKDQDVIILPYADVNMLHFNTKVEHLEQKLNEASNTIREKDLRLSKLQTLISSADQSAPEDVDEATSVDQLVAELERHLEEKLQAEIQCLVMLRARHSWQVRVEDQIALAEHRLSAAAGAEAGGGATARVLRNRLRETESKIVTLKKQVDRLEVHEKELYQATEALRVQSRTFKVTLFGLVQLAMLCVSLRVFLARVSSASFGDDVVPT